MASGKSAEYKLAIKIAGKIESSFNSALGAASKSLSALGGAAAKAAQIGAAAITAATTAAVAFAKSSIDVGMEFDKSMSQVAATMGTTVDQIGDLRQFAMDMGASTAFSAQQAAEGLNILAMAGLSAEEQMAALPDVLNLAAAGALTLEQAASYTAGAVKGFSDSMENAQYYTDLIAKGATLANTDVSGLGEALGRSAATAKTYGQTADSVTLSLLRLADQNVTGEAASTALNRAMSDLYTPTAAAQKALKALGVSAYTSTGEARDFNEVVADLKESLSGMSDKQANAYAAAIFTTQGLNAFNKMTAASTETMDKFTKGLEEASGSAAQQAETQLDNLAGSITLFQSAMEGAQIVVSDQLKPMLNDFVKFGAQSVSDLTAAFKNGGLDAAMEALGGILSEGLNMVIAQLPGAINAGMQLLGALGKGLLNNLPTITSAMIQIGTMLVDGITQAAPALLQGGVQLISQLAIGIASAIPTLANGAVGLIREISNAITTNVPLLADGLVSAIPEFVSIAGDLLGALGEAILQNLPVLAGAAVTIMTGLGDYLKENLPSIIASGLEFITAFTGSLRENAGLMVDGAISLILSLAQGLADSLPTLIQNVPQIVSNIANIINDNAPKLITAALDLIVTLGKGLIMAIPTLIVNIPQIIGAIVDTLMAFNWLNLGSSLLKSLGSGVKAAFSFLKDIGKQVLQAIKGGFRGLPQAMAAIGRSLLQGIWSGIKAAFGWLRSQIGSILKAIVSAVKSFFGIHSPSTVFADIGKNLVLGLLEGIQAIWNTIVDFFAGAVDGLLSFFSGLWTNIQTIWGSVATWFQVNVINPLVNFFAPIVETVGGFFSGLWSGIQGVWFAVSGWFNSTVIQPTVNFFSGIVGVVSEFFSNLWATIQGIWTAVASWFDSTVIQPLVNFFSPIVETVGGFFSSLWDNISGIWQAAGSWFNDNVATPINNAFQSVSDFVTGIFNGLSEVIEGVINKVGGFLNDIGEGIGNVVETVGSFLGISSSTPAKANTNVSIPKLAEGGIATGPTFAEIGEGGEPEVVLPLSKLAVLMDSFIGDAAPAVNAKALADAPQLRKLPAMASSEIAAPLLAQMGKAEAPGTIQPLTKLDGILKGVVGGNAVTTVNSGNTSITGDTASSILAESSNAIAQSMVNSSAIANTSLGDLTSSTAWEQSNQRNATAVSNLLLASQTQNTAMPTLASENISYAGNQAGDLLAIQNQIQKTTNGLSQSFNQLSEITGGEATSVHQNAIANVPEMQKLPSTAHEEISSPLWLQMQVMEAAAPGRVQPLAEVLNGMVGGNAVTTLNGGDTSINKSATSSIFAGLSNAVTQSQINSNAIKNTKLQDFTSASFAQNTVTAPAIAQAGIVMPELVTKLGSATTINNGDTTSITGGAMSALARETNNDLSQNFRQPQNFVNSPTWTIPAMAEGGIATGPIIAQVGEAGTEAIIPLSDLWSNMQSIVAGAVGNSTGTFSNIADRLDAADAGTETMSISDLLEQITGEKAETGNGGGDVPVQVYYSPTNHYHFDGGTPNREEIAAAEEMSMEKFERYMRQYEKDRARTNLRG